MSTNQSLDAGWPKGVARRVLDTIDSTNAEAARIGPDLAGPTWILARSQTAGRGRRGRDWHNPTGNFTATYVMHPDEPPATVALRSFVAALALSDAVATVTGRSDGLSLKWPNDVLLNGGKLAGILLESNGAGGKVAQLAIGIGVNLAAVPDVDQVEPTALRPVSLVGETDIRVTPLEFLDVLAPAYDHWEHRFVTYGFAPIQQAWLSRAAKLGQVITARTGKDENTGTFETVDEQGNLVLSTSKGRRAIPAADVFF